MVIDWTRWGYPNDEQERERIWAEEFHTRRKRLVANVEQALAIKDPKKRKELYQAWRQTYGDDVARADAKYTEACIAGRVKLAPIKNMVNAVEGKPQTKIDF